MISELKGQLLVCVSSELKIGRDGRTDSGMKNRCVHRLSRNRIVAVMMIAGIASGDAIAGTESEEVSAHVLAAEIALENQEYKTAAFEYRKAAELSEDVDVARQATRIGFTYGFNEDALRAAKRWMKLDKDSDEALLYVAQLQLRVGDVRASSRSMSRLLKGGEQPADERLVALIPLLSQEDPRLADELMRQLARPYKDSAPAQYAAGVMALQAGDSEEALDRAARALELRPEWTRAELLKARAMLLAGDQEGAIDYTARIVGDDPDPDPEARMELAIMLLSAGRDDDALSQVNQILLEQPSRTDALRLMAIINFRLDRLDAAWADFQDVLASGHYTMDALYYLGRISDRRSEYEQAIRLYSQVQRGSNAVISQRRASALMAQQGDEEDALEHLRQFGGDNPTYAVDMVEAEAQLLASMQRYDDALEAYDRVIEFRPESETAVLGRAELLLRMDRLDEAINEYRQCVKRWPDSAMSLNALGYTLADRTQEYEEAEKLIKKALKLDPDSPAIIDSYGWVLYRLGDNERALEELKRAYTMLKDPEVASHVVEVLATLERLDEASKILEEAELLHPDNELLQNIRERVFPEE
jgi:tetratricopeptide (TPR) repeat protein